MKKLLVSCGLAALATGNAYAQSTGSVDFENTIVVTGSRTAGVNGVSIPQTARTKGVLSAEFIGHTTPGQSINDTINMLPGVSFQNNDPFGSAGGTLSIRGFDSTRISQTFDGVPLNDTGSYEIYANQQVDPELIEQVNVNLGTTDVDSPSAGASGSTVNYRTRNPSEDPHIRIQGSAGNYDFMRLFGVVDTGAVGPWGTRAFFAASKATNNAPYGHRGEISKWQINGKLYQPIGSGGDFISIAGHYNQNRNGFFGSVPLRTDNTQLTTNATTGVTTSTPRVIGSDTTNRFPDARSNANYTIPYCTVQVARSGLVDAANTCGSTFDERYNPSNTGNIRINSRFTLADGLVLTVDPSYQYTLANGGGTVVANEGRRDEDPSGTPSAATCTAATVNGAGVNCQPGYFAGVPYANHDLNGDGDALDTVRLVAPSTTQTHRYGINASLRYDISPEHSLRVAYTLDYGRHRQTGEIGQLLSNGVPVDLFPRVNPILDSNGSVLQKRDRLSKAILNQVSGEYTGHFFDKLTVTAGVRAPFMERKLDQRCFTSSIGGFVECPGTNASAATITAIQAANPYVVSAAGVPSGFAPPQMRDLKYNKLLPSAGLVYKIDQAISIHASFSTGIQVPGTDNLYNSFYYPVGTTPAKPKPETTSNFDLGARYSSSRFQAELTGWYTRFNNRLSQAYDPIVDRSVYTNLGRVNRWGIDSSVSYKPMRELSLYVFGSYLKSKIADNVVAGGATTNCSGATRATATTGTTGQLANCFFTKGKRESFQPVYTLGGRAEVNLSPVVVGMDVKRTGKRYINDQNVALALCTGTASASGLVCTGNGAVQYSPYGKAIPAYTLVNFDVRVSLEPLVHTDRTYLQFNVTNAFNKFFVGGSSTKSQINPSAAPAFFQIGTPRGVSGTLVVGF